MSGGAEIDKSVQEVMKSYRSLGFTAAATEQKMTQAHNRITGSLKSQNQEIDRMRIFTSGARREIGEFRNQLLLLNFVLGVGTAAFGKFVGTFVNAFQQQQKGMLGVAAMAKTYGIAIKDATGVAKEFADTGLMSVAEASTSLKNLLAKGFSLQEAKDIIKVFMDTAAFGRQGMLEFGQAVVGATEGIKDDISAKSDNAGMTKNLSQFVKEYADSIDKSSKSLTEAEKRTAYYTGILREGMKFQGQAAILMQTTAGRTEMLRTQYKNLQAQIGEALIPAYRLLINALLDGVMVVQRWVSVHRDQMMKAAVVVFAVITTAARNFVDIVTNKVFLAFAGILLYLRLSTIASQLFSRVLATQLFLEMNRIFIMSGSLEYGLASLRNAFRLTTSAVWGLVVAKAALAAEVLLVLSGIVALIGAVDIITHRYEILRDRWSAATAVMMAPVRKMIALVSVLGTVLDGLVSPFIKLVSLSEMFKRALIGAAQITPFGNLVLILSRGMERVAGIPQYIQEQLGKADYEKSIEELTSRITSHLAAGLSGDEASEKMTKAFKQLFSVGNIDWSDVFSEKNFLPADVLQFVIRQRIAQAQTETQVGIAEIVSQMRQSKYEDILSKSVGAPYDVPRPDRLDSAKAAADAYAEAIQRRLQDLANKQSPFQSYFEPLTDKFKQSLKTISDRLAEQPGMKVEQLRKALADVNQTYRDFVDSVDMRAPGATKQLAKAKEQVIVMREKLGEMTKEWEKFTEATQKEPWEKAKKVKDPLKGRSEAKRQADTFEEAIKHVTDIYQAELDQQGAFWRAHGMLIKNVMADAFQSMNKLSTLYFNNEIKRNKIMGLIWKSLGLTMVQSTLTSIAEMAQQYAKFYQLQAIASFAGQHWIQGMKYLAAAAGLSALAGTFAGAAASVADRQQNEISEALRDQGQDQDQDQRGGGASGRRTSAAVRQLANTININPVLIIEGENINIGPQGIEDLTMRFRDIVTQMINSSSQTGQIDVRPVAARA